MVYKKFDPIIAAVENEFKITEEYKVKKKHEKILKKYINAKTKFEKKYEDRTYDYCYDVFGVLRNKEYLKELQDNYRAQQQYYSSYYENFKSNYSNNYNSGYFENRESTYNEDDKAKLKKIYKVLALKFHPDRNNDDADMMKFINTLKEKWSLVPSVLSMVDEELKCRDEVKNEFLILKCFVDKCDLSGIRIINDSVELREKYLSFNTFNIFNINQWPNKKLLEVMAFAQYSGVPTSLLDWSKRSYVAAYFAASSAVENYDKRCNTDRLAVWALDVEKINLYKNIELVKVPGSTSDNLADQSGVFTLLRQSGERGQIFYPKYLEDEFKTLPQSSLPLYKITVPIKYSTEILELCELYGVSGATLFPGYNGVSKSVYDYINKNKIK